MLSIMLLIAGQYDVSVVRSYETAIVRSSEVRQRATPAAAAVLVSVKGRDSQGPVTFSGCGTVLSTGEILTCAHIGRWQWLAEPKYFVTRRGGGDVSATVVKRDSRSDLCLLQPDASLSGVELAMSNASGSVLSLDKNGVQRQGITVNIPSPDTTFTTLFLQEGDSGCGLFVDGKLAGVFSGITNDGKNRRIFANTDEIRRFLDKPPSGAAIQNVRPRFPRVLFFSAAWCGPCQIPKTVKRKADDLTDFEWLQKNGWQIDESERAHIQIVDVDKSQDLVAQYKVESVPTLVLLDVGNVEVDRSTYSGRSTIDDLMKKLEKPVSSSSVEASPTPADEVERVIGILPKPEVAFVEFGCGSDARWCVAATRRWKCKAIGIEIDPSRAALARRRVWEDGLSEFITIIEGDATTTDIQADVGAAYLYEEVLTKLRPRLERLRAFASFMHRPPGLTASQNGDSWIYTKPIPVKTAVPRGAVWGGQVYSGPVCNNPRCSMCNSIRSQLNWR